MIDFQMKTDSAGGIATIFHPTPDVAEELRALLRSISSKVDGTQDWDRVRAEAKATVSEISPTLGSIIEKATGPKSMAAIAYLALLVQILTAILGSNSAKFSSEDVVEIIREIDHSERNPAMLSPQDTTEQLVPIAPIEVGVPKTIDT